MIAEIEKLVVRKKKIITDVISWQKVAYPKRTTEYNKCKQDMEYVIDAYISDLSNNSTTHIITVGNKFWVGNIRQIKSYEVEVAIHNYIILYISKKVISNKEVLQKLTSLKNIFISILQNGPINQFNFLQNTEAMQHCQRNFDLTKTVSDDVLNWLYDIGYSTPTKQNLNSFQIVAFKDRSTIFEIAKSATSVYDELDTVNEELKEEIRSLRRMQNPQVNANLLFLFFIRSESKTSHERLEREGLTGETMDHWRSVTNFEMGLSASAIALAAHTIGLKTGFCRCFNRDMLAEVVHPLGLSVSDFYVALGVGYPIAGIPHYVHTSIKHTSEVHKKEPFTRMIY